MAKERAETSQKQIGTPAQGRPPVVAVLGHVDHGKTSLLDFIRKSSVTAKEAGGITQHIGAHQIDFKGKKITFIDTPGHEAFSAMRARGGKASDLAVLVVAADDGVMPQTKESIAHIKAAGVPFIVAINKIDVSGANVEKVKNQLAAEDVQVEGFGGDVVAVPVSAKTGQGVEELLEMVDLVSQMQQLKDEREKPAAAVVIESRLDKFKGALASVIVKEGILRVGDPIYTDAASGKVKSLINHLGKPVKEADSGTPVEILGFSKPPKVGEKVTTTLRPSEKPEEQVKRVSLEDRLAEPSKNEIRLIIKADVTGSIEAITSSLESLKKEDQEVKIYYSDTGDITEGDVLLATATKSLIIGFNVSALPSANKLASEEGVLIRSFNVIYELVDELREGLEALGMTGKAEEVLGEAQVLATFKTTAGKVAGCKVLAGKINKDNLIILKSGDKEKGRSEIASMKHKDTVIREAIKGDEFGLSLEKDLPFTKSDIIVAIGS